MPSEALKALARSYASRIVSGQLKPSDGARAIWTDVFYHLEPGDHYVDGFVYWAYALEDAEDEARREFCESAIVNTARGLLGGGLTLDELAGVQWLDPWRPVVAGLEAELKSEASAGHPLFGQQAVSVGRRTDTDDVLFLLDGHPAPLAVVRLTWSGRRERNPEWPQTTFYSSLEDWIERCMRLDHLHHG